MNSKNSILDKYYQSKEPSERYKSYAWKTGAGLQQVDNLKVSKYLLDTAERNIKGEINIAEAEELIKSYYEEKATRESAAGGFFEGSRQSEADLVSLRIAELIQEEGFVFSAQQILSINKRLFGGIYKHAGQIRDYNITKAEWVLNGASVGYGNSLELKEMLEYDIDREKTFKYEGLSMDEIISHLARFTSDLWQIHPFGEGNTRTVAVFLIKYLKTFGFDVTNDIFAENAWYFRNALVRANYSDIFKGIHETTDYLKLFLENLLLEGTNDLSNKELHVDFNRGIEVKEPIFALGFYQKTYNNIERIRREIGQKSVFGRSDVTRILGITETPASALIKKMFDNGLITKAQGYGKGRYIFKQQFFHKEDTRKAFSLRHLLYTPKNPISYETGFFIMFKLRLKFYFVLAV